MEIRTVAYKVNQTDQFDQRVNRWLAEGWELDEKPIVQEGYLFAMLKKEVRRSIGEDCKRRRGQG